MIPSQDLTFNVIYTPGTVRYLRLFIFSLLQWSDCSYRLVSNGCSREEAGLLEILCSQNSRVAFYSLSSDKVLTHAEALSSLQRLENSDYFCFIDSDVLAVGDFLSPLQTHLGQNPGVFSGDVLWSARRDRIIRRDSKKIRGIHSHTEDGLCLGSTFTGIYDNKKLTQFIDSEGISFDRYPKRNKIPADIRSRLLQEGFKNADSFDTGKALNILIQSKGERILFTDSPALIHIGGLSENLGQMAPHAFKRTPSSSLHHRLKRLERRILNWKDFRSYKIRDAICEHFIDLFACLFENRPFLWRLALRNEEVMKKVHHATEKVMELYAEYSLAQEGEVLHA